MSVARKWPASRLLIWLVLILGGLVSLFPFFWMVIGTTLNPNDVVRGIIVPGKEFDLNWAKAI